MTDSTAEWMLAGVGLVRLLSDTLTAAMQIIGRKEKGLAWMAAGIQPSISMIAGRAIFQYPLVRRLEKYMYHSETSSYRSPFILAFFELEHPRKLLTVAPQLMRFIDRIVSAVLEKETSTVSSRRIRAPVGMAMTSASTRGIDRAVSVMVDVDNERAARIPVVALHDEIIACETYLSDRVKVSEVPVHYIARHGGESRE